MDGHVSDRLQSLSDWFLRTTFTALRTSRRFEETSGTITVKATYPLLWHLEHACDDEEQKAAPGLAVTVRLQQQEVLQGFPAHAVTQQQKDICQHIPTPTHTQALQWLTDCSDTKYSRVSWHPLSHNNIKNTFISTHTHTHTHTLCSDTKSLQWHEVLQGVLAPTVTQQHQKHIYQHTHTHTHFAVTLSHCSDTKYSRVSWHPLSHNNIKNTFISTFTHTHTPRGKEQQANTIKLAHTMLRKLLRWDNKARSRCIPIQNDHICTLKILWSMSKFSGLWKQ